MFPVVTDNWPIEKPCEAIGVAARVPHLRIVKTDIGVRAEKRERGLNRGARAGFTGARTFARCCGYTTVCSIRPDRANDVRLRIARNPRMACERRNACAAGWQKVGVSKLTRASAVSAVSDVRIG